MWCCVKKPGTGARAAKWKRTGIVGLRECGLKALPPHVIELRGNVRTLDASRNKLAELPLQIEVLVNLQRLILAENCLTRLPSTLGRLRSLKVLTLDGNRLSEIPDEVGLLVRLEQLSVAKNSLSALPSTIGSLHSLALLNISDNQIKHLPASLGSCGSLEELVANGNLIEELPQDLSNLSKLKTLELSENKIVQLPASLLTDLKVLQTLSLHGNPFTLEQLQQMDNYEAYEGRRRKKFDKQIDTNVMTNSRLFDEGIDRK